MRGPFAKVYCPFDLKDVFTFRTEWRQTACTVSLADGREVGFRDRGLVVLNRTLSYSTELHHVDGPWIRRPPGPLTLCLIVTPPYPARVVPSLSARQSKYAQRYHIEKRFLFPPFTQRSQPVIDNERSSLSIEPFILNLLSSRSGNDASFGSPHARRPQPQPAPSKDAEPQTLHRPRRGSR